MGGLSSNVQMSGKESGPEHFHSVFFFLFVNNSRITRGTGKQGWHKGKSLIRLQMYLHFITESFTLNMKLILSSLFHFMI